MTLPSWLASKVGAPTRRSASSHRCQSCKASILAGLDGDQCAFHTTVDPIPLTPLGEALALLAGRRTYELRAGNLYRRDRWQITGNPAGAEHIVLADHACHSPPLPHIDIPILPKPRKKASTNDNPPF